MIEVDLKQLHIAYDELDEQKKLLADQVYRVEQIRRELSGVFRDAETDLLMHHLGNINRNIYEESRKLNRLQNGISQVSMVYHETENRILDSAQQIGQQGVHMIDYIDFEKLNEIIRDVTLTPQHM